MNSIGRITLELSRAESIAKEKISEKISNYYVCVHENEPPVLRKNICIEDNVCGIIKIEDIKIDRLDPKLGYVYLDDCIKTNFCGEIRTYDNVDVSLTEEFQEYLEKRQTIFLKYQNSNYLEIVDTGVDTEQLLVINKLSS